MREGVDLYSRASLDRQLPLKRVVEVSHAAETMVSIVIGTAIGVQQGIISEQPSRVGPSKVPRCDASHFRSVNVRGKLTLVIR
jgi:hypothetical protein